LQDFGDCIQSSQIGPHLVQPFKARPIAITLKIRTTRRNMNVPTPPCLAIMGRKSGIFKPSGPPKAAVPFRKGCLE
jgi:hypothetical protein